MPGKSMALRKGMLYSKKPKMGQCDMNPHKTVSQGGGSKRQNVSKKGAY